MYNYQNANPMQSAFPPVQSAFPPIQSAFPPIQSAFPPIQSAFPPVQSAFPPVQSAFPSVQSTFPPVQSTFPPVQSAFPQSLPPVQSFIPQTSFAPLERYQPTDNSSGMLQQLNAEIPDEPIQVVQAVEKSQRPTAFVSRIYNSPSVIEVPQEVEAYRKLTREERALKQTNPRLLTAMAVRCTSCKKVIKQLSIEDALLSGQTLREVMDNQGYIRICCRKQIQNEPAVVNIQNQMALQSNTINMMNNLSISSTASALMGRRTFNSAIPSKIKILDSAPANLIHESIQLVGSNTIGISDSFSGASPIQMRDSYSMSVENLNRDNADEY